MLRKSLFGQWSNRRIKSQSAKRLAGFRAGFEPLEDRKLLTASAWINEVYFNPPGSNDTVTPWEYIELRGTAELQQANALDNHYLIFIENEDNAIHTGNAGKIDKVIDLSGEEFGSNGFLVLSKPGNPYHIDPSATQVVYPSNADIEGSGFTAMLISTDGAPANVPVVGQDLDERVNSLDDTPGALNNTNDGLDFPNAHPGWTIMDAIGIHGEADEPANGRLYAPINFGSGNADTHIEPNAVYFKILYEIEYIARWGDSTGQTEADWHIANLTDNALSGYLADGDFRMSGEGTHPNVTSVDTNKGVPYGTNMTGTVGSSNYPHVPTVDLNGGGSGNGINYGSAWNGSSPVNISDNLIATLTDDDLTLTSMTATLPSPHPGDVLSATGTGGISVSYNAGNGVLSMTGSSSVANYQAVLRTITYNNTSGGPGTGPVIVNVAATDAIGGTSANAVATVSIPAVNSTVVARKIFYNQSAYDGTTAASSAAINFFSDNLAIATDKTAYLPGDPKAVAFNVTNYTRGINGIIIDLAGGGTHQSINAGDFVFKVGNNNTPSSWAAAPSTASIAVSLGGGVGGSDRVEITWASGAISNKWLEVQVLATSHTGLTSPDVFFWGNKLADSASGALDANNFITNSTDATQVFATLTPVNGATITNVRDYNRDKTVNSTDATIVFAQLGNLNRLLVGSAGPFAPEGGGGGGGDAGISSALAGGGGGSAASSAGQALPTALLPTAIRERLEGGGGGGSAAIDAALTSSLADDDAAQDDGADDMDELLDSLAAAQQ